MDKEQILEEIDEVFHRIDQAITDDMRTDRTVQVIYEGQKRIEELLT